MGFLGMDVVAIRHLSRQLNTQADEVRAAANELNSLIVNTEWFGADQAAFVRDWEASSRPALLRASNLLREASQIAQQGAQDQERASRGR